MEPLTVLGKKVLDGLKERIAEGLMSEEDDYLAELAVTLGLIRQEPYDPEKHHDFNADEAGVEPGDIIYYWGK